MKKILFIQLPNFFIYKDKMFLNKIYPIGISYLAGYLKAKNTQIDIDFFDFNAKENKTVTESIEELKENILPNKSYDFICFSLRQIDGFFFPERLEKKALDKIINRIGEIVGKIKDKTNSTLVIGGPGFSTYEKELSKVLPVDYGVVGEGEGVLNNLINKGESGLTVKKSGDIKILSDNNCVDLESHSPLFFNLSDYRNVPIGLQTHRGCPFNCLYCNYKYIEGGAVRFFPVENIISQLKELKRNGIEKVYFVDSVMNIQKKYFDDLLSKMISEKIKINWHAYLDFNLDKETISLLKDSGCEKISFSPDSGSNKILKELHKDIDSEKILETAQLLSNTNPLKICYNFLFNSPSESIDTLEETLETIKKLVEIHEGSLLFWFSPLMVLPNSDLRKLYGKEYPKWATSPVSEIINSSFDKTFEMIPDPLSSMESSRAFFKEFIHSLEEEIKNNKNNGFKNK